jgi:integrase
MSVYKRKNKNGSFTWWFTKTINGERHRRRIPTARTKAQAEEAERDYLKQIHDGEFDQLKGTITLKEFVEETYLKWTKDHKRSWKADTFRVKAILAFFGKKRLCDISPFLIESYKIKRLKTPIEFKKKTSDGYAVTTRPRSVAVVNRELCLLSAIFRVAIKKKQATKNPCHEVELLKGEKPRKRFLYPEEEDRLMKVLVGTLAHFKDLVRLAIYTGLRQAELLKLAVDDVDLVKRELKLRETKSGVGREVPLNKTAEEIVLRLLDKAKARDWTYLFTNPATGTRFLHIHHGWWKALKLADINDLHFHDLRHTFGTRAIENGATLAEVKELMGHKSIATTENYCHATEAGKRRAVDAVEKSGHVTVTRGIEERELRLVNH